MLGYDLQCVPTKDITISVVYYASLLDKLSEKVEEQRSRVNTCKVLDGQMLELELETL